MGSRLRNIFYGFAIFGASAITSFTAFNSQQVACAQTASYSECVSYLISLGVSPDIAAQQCQEQTNHPTSCIDRLMYGSARASSGPTDKDEWRFYQVYGPIDGSAMRAAGCRMAGFLGANGWRCPRQDMRFQVMTAADAQAQCSGRLPAIQTLLNASGLIGSAGMKFQHFFTGSQNQRIRIQVTGRDNFDPVVVLEDGFGNFLSQDDDSGSNNLSAELEYTLPRQGSYRAIVSGYQGSQGAYNILIETNLVANVATNSANYAPPHPSGTTTNNYIIVGGHSAPPTHSSENLTGNFAGNSASNPASFSPPTLQATAPSMAPSALSTAPNTDPVIRMLSQWEWTRMPCNANLPVAAISGLAPDAVCVQPTATIPAGNYRFDSTTNQLVPIASSSNTSQSPTPPAMPPYPAPEPTYTPVYPESGGI